MMMEGYFSFPGPSFPLFGGFLSYPRYITISTLVSLPGKVFHAVLVPAEREKEPVDFGLFWLGEPVPLAV